MLTIPRDTDITLASRFECKYLISPIIVPKLRRFIEPFARPDSFAARRKGNCYPICSLYLDTDDLALYQQTVGGDMNRFKLRVRSYSDDPSTPVFFEVKRKTNNIISKRRARLDRRRATILLREGGKARLGDLPRDLRSDVDYFAKHADLSGAKPVVRVKYVREAYESRGGDPVRLTLDTELQHAATLNDTLSHEAGRWVRTPVDGVILEIKFTDRYPSWVHDMVWIFGLNQRPVPKYVWSIDHMLLEQRESVLSIAGFTLPPRRA